MKTIIPGKARTRPAAASVTHVALPRGPRNPRALPEENAHQGRACSNQHQMDDCPRSDLGGFEGVRRIPWTEHDLQATWLGGQDLGSPMGEFSRRPILPAPLHGPFYGPTHEPIEQLAAPEVGDAILEHTHASRNLWLAGADAKSISLPILTTLHSFFPTL